MTHRPVLSVLVLAASVALMGCGDNTGPGGSGGAAGTGGTAGTGGIGATGGVGGGTDVAGAYQAACEVVCPEVYSGPCDDGDIACCFIVSQLVELPMDDVAACGKSSGQVFEPCDGCTVSTSFSSATQMCCQETCAGGSLDMSECVGL